MPPKPLATLEHSQTGPILLLSPNRRAAESTARSGTLRRYGTESFKSLSGLDGISSGPKLEPWDAQYAKEVFEAYDYDRSGQIELTELKELLHESQWLLDSETAESFISKFLGEDVQPVNFERFLKLYRAMGFRQPASARKFKAKVRVDVNDLRALEAKARAIFQELDSEGQLCLGEVEMRKVMKAEGVPDIDGDNYEALVAERMKWIDKNQDGLISFEEFVWYRNAVIDNFFQFEEAAEDERQRFDTDPWDPRFFAN